MGGGGGGASMFGAGDDSDEDGIHSFFGGRGGMPGGFGGMGGMGGMGNGEEARFRGAKLAGRSHSLSSRMGPSGQWRPVSVQYQRPLVRCLPSPN